MPLIKADTKTCDKLVEPMKFNWALFIIKMRRGGRWGVVVEHTEIIVVTKKIILISLLRFSNFQQRKKAIFILIILKSPVSYPYYFKHEKINIQNWDPDFLEQFEPCVQTTTTTGWLLPPAFSLKLNFWVGRTKTMIHIWKKCNSYLLALGRYFNARHKHHPIIGYNVAEFRWVWLEKNT